MTEMTCAHLYDVHAGHYTVSVSYSWYHMQCCRRFVSPPWQPHIMSNYISIISLITIYISISWVISLMTMLHYVVLISLTVINGDIINLHFLLYDHICCSTMPSKSSWWTHIMLCYPSSSWVPLMGLRYVYVPQSDATLSNHLDIMYSFILCLHHFLDNNKRSYAISASF